MELEITMTGATEFAADMWADADMRARSRGGAWLRLLNAPLLFCSPISITLQQTLNAGQQQSVR
jgi:hypothetical protein